MPRGFYWTGAVAPDPIVDAPPGMNLRGFEGRFPPSLRWVFCIEALAAQGEVASAAAKLGAASRAVGRPTVTTTLTERKPLGRRFELRCSN